MEQNNNDEQVVVVMISEEGIAEYLYNQLIARNMIPQAEDLGTLSEIVFDFLIDIGVMDEVDVEDYDPEE